MKLQNYPLRPDRIRHIEKPFGWLPLRLLQENHLAAMSNNAQLLYFFLCLVSDRQGISFYSDNRIRTYLHLEARELEQARVELKEKDLLAYDGRIYQVLCLPSKRSSPPKPPQTPRAASRRTGEPESFKAILARMLKTTE